ncbi:MAG TPA: tetratricopeptide repeat protein [Rhodothermales bacterium]|nr:tetratricopeptide repeat protein [Rhodothermales bacterium]
MSKATTSSEPALSRGKRRLFTAAMWLLPVFFFLLLEGTLRLGGYGDEYPLFVETPGHPEYLYQNRDVARRYFFNQASPPTSQVDYFKAEKDSATFRIFVQGGSTGAGYPFYYGGSFSRMLEQRLLQTFPERTIEVVNTSLAAVNSYTLLDLADEIIAQEPDAVLIYTGHNEFYGALGVGSSESLGRFPFFVNLYLRLQPLRTVQGLRAILSKFAGLFGDRKQGEVPSSTLMERMVGEQSIPYGSQLFDLGLLQFHSNLSSLLATYQKYGIPVFIGTLASNERGHKPFISNPSPGTDEAAWNQRYQQGQMAASSGDTTAALSAFSEAIALDSIAADAFYARARLYDASHRYDEARSDYLAAKDRDQLRFRASEEINAIIQEAAARYGATVVPTREALATDSPGGIIGDNLMMEHLHPNVDGYFLLSDAFYEALRQANLIGTWSRPVLRTTARREVLLTAVDSLNGVFRVRTLMGSWPFQPPGVVDRSMDTVTARNPIEELGLKLARGKMKRQDAVEALRVYYEQQGDLKNTLKVSLALIQDYPFVPGPYIAAGNTLLRQGRSEEALAYFEAANDLEASSLAERMIGSILLQRAQQRRDQQQIHAAITHLQRALELDAENIPALYNLSGAYALLGQYDDARRTVERLLQLAPNHADGQRLLNSLPPADTS